MGAAFALFVVLIGLPILTLLLGCAILGLHAVLVGRMPGRWLQRKVHRPRLWGAGALLVAVALYVHPFLLIVGLGLMILGHLMDPK